MEVKGLSKADRALAGGCMWMVTEAQLNKAVITLFFASSIVRLRASCPINQKKFKGKKPSKSVCTV